MAQSERENHDPALWDFDPSMLIDWRDNAELREFAIEQSPRAPRYLIEEIGAAQ